jgi:trehalose 6-phosphate phosphatase
LNQPDVLAIYIGDDTTDEEAFRALEGRGIGIYVGPESQTTAALYGLPDPDEVRKFLTAL